MWHHPVLEAGLEAPPPTRALREPSGKPKDGRARHVVHQSPMFSSRAHPTLLVVVLLAACHGSGLLPQSCP